MRIAVIGTSGSGKTTLARRLAAELGLPHVELDAINWQPGWRGLNEHDPEELRRQVAHAAADDGWVIEGGYGGVRDLIWGRATHIVWLDYERSLIMRQVIWRSFVRAVDRRPLWNGNRERWWWFLRADHPIRWAWSTWARRRAKFEEMTARPQYTHLKVIRIRRRKEAEAMVAALAGERGAADQSASASSRSAR